MICGEKVASGESECGMFIVCVRKKEKDANKQPNASLSKRRWNRCPWAGQMYSNLRHVQTHENRVWIWNSWKLSKQKFCVLRQIFVKYCINQEMWIRICRNLKSINKCFLTLRYHDDKTWTVRKIIETSDIHYLGVRNFMLLFVYLSICPPDYLMSICCLYISLAGMITYHYLLTLTLMLVINTMYDKIVKVTLFKYKFTTICLI